MAQVHQSVGNGANLPQPHAPSLFQSFCHHDLEVNHAGCALGCFSCWSSKWSDGQNLHHLSCWLAGELARLCPQHRKFRGERPTQALLKPEEVPSRDHPSRVEQLPHERLAAGGSYVYRDSAIWMALPWKFGEVLYQNL